MGSLFSQNRGVIYLLCVIDVFSKYGRVKFLKDKKVTTALTGFIKIGNESSL